MQNKDPQKKNLHVKISQGFETINNVVSGLYSTSFGIIPLKMSTLRWTKFKRDSPSFWRTPAEIIISNKWKLNVRIGKNKKKPYNQPVTIINCDPADTDKSVLAEIFAFLKKLDPCCKSIISPFNLFSKQSIRATSLDTCCHVAQKDFLLSIIFT